VTRLFPQWQKTIESTCWSTCGAARAPLVSFGPLNAIIGAPSARAAAIYIVSTRDNARRSYFYDSRQKSRPTNPTPTGFLGRQLLPLLSQNGGRNLHSKPSLHQWLWRDEFLLGIQPIHGAGKAQIGWTFE
jgi:hypothetical protein